MRFGKSSLLTIGMCALLLILASSRTREIVGASGFREVVRTRAMALDAVSTAPAAPVQAAANSTWSCLPHYGKPRFILTVNETSPFVFATSAPPEDIHVIRDLGCPVFLPSVSSWNSPPSCSDRTATAAQRLPRLSEDQPLPSRLLVAPAAHSARPDAALTGFDIRWNPVSCWGDTTAWPPNAQDAVVHAMKIWERLLVSPQPIVVDACWRTDLVFLAEGGPTSIHADFIGAGEAATLYPASLANALASRDLNDHDGWDSDKDGKDADSELAVEFNSSKNWYFGTDGNTPADKLDLVSTVLHEIGHGLGFQGFAEVDTGNNACKTDAFGDGCLGWQGKPAIYDHFTADGAGRRLLDYPNPSADLGRALQGQAGGLVFAGPYANTANGGTPPRLYAPGNWNVSSYSHLDDIFNYTANSLMTREQFNGVSEHQPGPVALGILQDMGWTTVTIEHHLVHLPLLSAHQPTSPTWVTLFNDGFEGDFPGAGWIVVDENPDAGLYTWAARDCQKSEGSFSAWSVGGGDTSRACGSTYPGAASAWMVYGPFSLADASAAELVFDWWSHTETGRDFFAWGASLDDFHYYGGKVSGDYSTWTRGERLDLSTIPTIGNLLGQPQVWIGFSFTTDSSGSYEGSYVDNVVLRKRVGAAAGVAGTDTPLARNTRPGQTCELFETTRSVQFNLR